jgi:hypothetical protein
MCDLCGGYGSSHYVGSILPNLVCTPGNFNYVCDSCKVIITENKKVFEVVLLMSDKILDKSEEIAKDMFEFSPKWDELRNQIKEVKDEAKREAKEEIVRELFGDGPLLGKIEKLRGTS